MTCFCSQDLIVFPDKEGKAEPQKGFNRHLRSEFPLFTGRQVSHFDKPICKPELKLRETTEDKSDGLQNSDELSANVQPFKKPSKLPEIKQKNQVDKSVIGAQNKKVQRRLTKKPDETDDEKWVIPSLAEAFALPDPLKGGKRPPKYKPEMPKKKDLKDWEPEFKSKNDRTSVDDGSSDVPKQDTPEDSYSLYPDSLAPML